MATEFTVNNSQEFQEMVDNGDFRISKAIVDSILSNLNTKKKNVHIFSVTCIEEDATYDITLERKHFYQTLDENFKFYLEKELYEDCSRIKKGMDILSQ